MRTYFLILSLLLGTTVYAQTSPEGLWMSYDDDGKTATALVRIVKINDQLIGQIENVFDQQAEAICRNCRGDRKNQPIVGLEIIRGVKLEAQNNKWTQGRILDPEDGTEYKLVLELEHTGQTLVVRGYWGLFWRTQYWQRQVQ